MLLHIQSIHQHATKLYAHHTTTTSIVTEEVRRWRQRVFDANLQTCKPPLRHVHLLPDLFDSVHSKIAKLNTILLIGIPKDLHDILPFAH